MLGPPHEETPTMQTVYGSQYPFELIIGFCPASVGMSVENIASYEHTISDISRHRTKLLPFGSQPTDVGDHMLIAIEPGTTIILHGIAKIDIMLSGAGIGFQIVGGGLSVDGVLIARNRPRMVIFDFTL